MSQNRHTSSHRKFHKKSQVRQRKSNRSNIGYEVLEPRQLLAVDVGLEIPGSPFGRALSPPNLTGGVGPNHIVQVIDGEFKVFDKFDGTELVSKALDTFWTDTGGAGDPGDPGAQSSEEMVQGTHDSRVLYDADTRRWFITSASNMDVITGALGLQSAVLVAVSRTSNPTQDWQSLTGLYDEDADPETPRVRYQGGFLYGAGSVTTNLGVDDDNIYVNVNDASPFIAPRTYVFNKFNDLVVPTPTNANATNLPSIGSKVQWASDVTGTEVGAFGLFAPTDGNQIILTEITNTASPGGANLEAFVAIDVDEYEAPPQFIRQEFDPDLVNEGSGFLSAPKRLGNSLWAAHMVLGSSDGQNPDGGPIETSAIRWYEIDLITKTVRQSGTIEHPNNNYIFPSIAVTQKGHVVISYTSAGVAPDGEPGPGLFPTATVSIGYNNNGVMIFEDPVNIKDGEGGYFDGSGNFWGTYMETVADPDDPDRVWSFNQWSDDGDDGQTIVVGLDLIGHTPTIQGTPANNVIVVRRSAADDTLIEVEIDGAVVASYDEEILYSITTVGGGGDDTFILDTSNGELNFVGGIHFEGDGDDQVELRTGENTTWEVGIDGRGTAAVGNDFPASCIDVHQEVVTFILNFEEGSQWFDTTPYNQNGYVTFGDALRGELQNYFDNVMAPIFAGTFTIELDINDDEVDTFASAAANGVGFEDVNGQNLLVASPWSILTGRGDRNSDDSDGVIEYNLGLDLYQGDREALLDNIRGGLTRNQFFRVLGMNSEIPNQTQAFDPRGTRNFGTVMDVGYRDLNDSSLIGNYDGNDNTFEVLNYVSNPNWAGDGTGIYFVGIDDSGNEMRLTVNSNTELIDFDTLASSLAGTSRDGGFNDIIEQDRAFLRGMGYTLNPVNPTIPEIGFPVFFSGVDEIQGGDGVDDFCIRSSNVDMQISGGIGNDNFHVTGLGVGAIDLFGQQGDDTYTVVFSPAGVITISDSVNSENDTLIGLGTIEADRFVFEVNGITVNAGLLVHSGIENISFDGREGDDIFEIKDETLGVIELFGGDGLDSFIVNDMGAGANGNTLTVSVNDPTTEPTDQIRLDVTSAITDTYLAQGIENLTVDGLFVIDGVNGTPTATGGLNLLGDGDDRLRLESTLDADWLIDGDGAGTVTMDVAPMTFAGLVEIDSSHGVDNFVVNTTNTDLLIRGREGDDQFRVNNPGSGVVTVNAGMGNDFLELLNSGGGVNLNGDDGDDTFQFGDVGLVGVSNLSGGEGNDDFTVTNAGIVGLTIDGDAGMDSFTIDNPTGTADVMVFGGDGNDLFEVVDSGLGQLDLFGEMGDDTYTVRYVDPTITFNIEDSINSENDTLIGFGTDGDDVFEITSDGVIVNGGLKWNVIGVENYDYDGLLGNDQFIVDMGNAWAGMLSLHGGEGDDLFTVDNSGSGAVTMFGDAGDDTYSVQFSSASDISVVDSLNDEADVFFGFGTFGADVIAINSGGADFNGGTLLITGVETIEIDGRSGNDVFDVMSTINDMRILGGTGNDTFNISATSDGNLFVGNDGNDIFNVVSMSASRFEGSAGNDEFYIASTTGGGEYFGGDDDDLFDIQSATGVTELSGDAGVDTFIITNHLALGSSGSIDIDGGTNRNQIIVNGYQTQANIGNVTNNQISGLSAVPINFTAAGSFTVANDQTGIQLIGSDIHNDRLIVDSFLATNSLTMLTGGGNDRFTVRPTALGSIRADGQEGSDIYQFVMGFNNDRNLFATDTGVVGTDRIVAVLTDGDDNLVLAGESFRVGNDNFGFNKNFESMVVNAGGGNDTIEINRLSLGFLRVIGGSGNDQFTVNNYSGINSILIEGGLGDDDFVANVGTVAGTLNALGGEGNDTFVISQGSYGDAFIDGQNGSDTYDIFIADRSDRTIVARDRGSFGTDELTVHGRVLDDVLTMRVGIVATPFQNIYFNNNTEIMNLETVGGNDRITIFGVNSPTTNIVTGNGNDMVVVNSTFGSSPAKALNINLGLGNDNAMVKGTQVDTTTSIVGGIGNDLINIGSSLASNNGNLGLISGAVHIAGNEGDDRVYVNDFGRNASFNYNVGATFLRNGGSNSNSFGGLTFDSTLETLRLDSTKFRNHVNVSASMDTRFSFFGNGGYNSVTLLGNPNDDGREFFGQNGGNGFWEFEDGSKDVFFSDFFIV